MNYKLTFMMSQSPQNKFIQKLCFLLLLGCPFAIARANDYPSIGHASWVYQPGAPSQIAGLAQSRVAWMSGSAAGLFRLDDVQSGRIDTFGGTWLLSNNIVAMFTVDDELWLGHQSGGVSVIKGNQLRNYTQADGLPAGSVHALARTHDGTMWLGTGAGLYFLSKGRWHSAGTEFGLPSVNVRFIRADSHGALWLDIDNDIYTRAPDEKTFHKELTVPGFRNIELTSDDIVWITNDTGEVMKYTPANRKLETLVVQDGLHGTIDLDGLSSGNGWINRSEMVERATPGPIVTVPQISFDMAASFVQGPWFKGICGFSLLFTLYLLYLWRISWITSRIKERLNERLMERERIARSLHDTLLQGVHSLTLKVQTASNSLPDELPARAELERALDSADQIMEDGRDEVMALRSTSELHGSLPETLNDLGIMLCHQYHVNFSLAVEGRQRETEALVNDDIYNIAREAMLNAFRHSQAKSIKLVLTYSDAYLKVQISDDGKGIDDSTRTTGYRPGHWGLQGMNERASDIDGTFEIWSSAGIGTEVSLTVPGWRAYCNYAGNFLQRWVEMLIVRRRALRRLKINEKRPPEK